jgi:hypothetical protein
LGANLFEGAEALDKSLAGFIVVGANAVEQDEGAGGGGEDEGEETSEARVEDNAGTQRARLWGSRFDDSFSVGEAGAIAEYCLDRIVQRGTESAQYFQRC